MNGKIVVSRHDAVRLRSLIGLQAATRAQNREHLEELEHELDRAVIVDGRTPDDRVAVDSTVLVRDVDSGERRIYALVFPSQADLAKGRVSVLAPLGTALLGYRAGDEVRWRMPGGLRRLKIEAVRHDRAVSAESEPDAQWPLIA